jgi:hypothetical protein
VAIEYVELLARLKRESRRVASRDFDGDVGLERDVDGDVGLERQQA